MQLIPKSSGWIKNYEKGRANFGVQKLPLFNILEPEYRNCGSFSGIRGGRGLNTDVSKFLLEEVVGVVIDF